VAANLLRTQDAQMATGWAWQAEQGGGIGAIRPGWANSRDPKAPEVWLYMGRVSAAGQTVDLC
jgi:hypothetical protein